MTQGALEIARNLLSVSGRTLHKVGDFELCDLDYRQVCLWAEQFNMTQDGVIKMLVEMTPHEEDPWLLEYHDEYQFSVENGNIKSLRWYFYETPEHAFQLLDGMLLERLCLYGSVKVDLFDGKEINIRLQNLKKLICSGCGIKHINLTLAPQLSLLDCEKNELNKLDLSAVPQLTKLSCGGNKLTELDLSAVPHLTNLWCWDNQLTALDLSAVPQLTKLVCDGNQLTELDLSAVPYLTWLRCCDNQLAELDLSATPQLTVLQCPLNQLSKLDLSTVPQLTVLWCWDNQLTELDIRSLKNLKMLKDDDNVRIIRNRP